MAAKFDWGDGKGKIRSISLKQHQDDLKVQAAAASRTPASTAAATALLGNSSTALKGQPAPTATPAATPAAPGTAAPPQPTAVQPFLNGDDLQAISQFYTDLNTKLAAMTADVGTYDPNAIDPATGKPGVWSGGNLETDTKYQESQNDKSATASTSAATDDAISRGIYSSSVTDANMYDIEAQRSLASKFLEDKLSSARLTAGTNKQILSTAKTDFDKRYGSTDANGQPIWGTKAFENAQGVNDPNNAAWASAMAAWHEANPTPAGPAAPAPPAAPIKGLKPQVPIMPQAAPRPANVSPTQSGTTKPAKPKVKTTKVVYGNTT